MSDYTGTTSETATTTAVKPGYKTTEFWLSTIALALGVIMSSGVIGDGTVAAQIVGGAMSILATLGYTAARAQAKR